MNYDVHNWEMLAAALSSNPADIHHLNRAQVSYFTDESKCCIIFKWLNETKVSLIWFQRNIESFTIFSPGTADILSHLLVLRVGRLYV